MFEVVFVMISICLKVKVLYDKAIVECFRNQKWCYKVICASPCIMKYVLC